MFCVKEVEDLNENPEDIEASATRKLMNSNISDPFSAYGMGLKFGIKAGNIKAVRTWLKEDYVNGKGAEEGTLRLELCAHSVPVVTEHRHVIRPDLRQGEKDVDSVIDDRGPFATGVGKGAKEVPAVGNSSEFDAGMAVGDSAAVGDGTAFSAGVSAGAAAADSTGNSAEFDAGVSAGAAAASETW